MKKSAILAAAVCGFGMIGSGGRALADVQTYDLDFAGPGVTANGQIAVDDSLGLAISGWLQLTSGPFTTPELSLYTWPGGGVSSIRVDGGTDLIVDNQVDVGSNPFLDVYGLAFTGDGTAGGYPAEGLDLSLDSGTAYNLAGYGIEGYGVPNVDGTATLTLEPVPEPSALALAGLGGIPFLFLRKRKS